jgi:hypothetical protein
MAAARARGGGGCGCGRRRGRKLRRSGSSRAQRWWSRGDILAAHRVGLELAWVGQGSQRKRMTARGKNGPSVRAEDGNGGGGEQIFGSK